MFRRITSPFARLSHQAVSLLVLGALLFLRIPFLTLIATFWTEGQTFAFFAFTIGTYLLTAFLIWWERDRLRAFWFDLASAIIFLCQMYLFAFGIGLFTAMRKSKARFPTPPPSLLRWMLIGGLLGILADIFTTQMHLDPPQPRADIPSSLGFLLSAVMIQTVNAAVWEEPLFRGFLWGYLRLAGWKNVWIWLFQALLFTFSHVYYLRTEPFPTFFLRIMIPALLIGLIAWCARSIAASMVTHGFLNAANDLIMHTGTLEQALSVAWTGAAILAAALVIVVIAEVLLRRRTGPGAKAVSVS